VRPLALGALLLGLAALPACGDGEAALFLTVRARAGETVRGVSRLRVVATLDGVRSQDGETALTGAPVDLGSRSLQVRFPRGRTGRVTVDVTELDANRAGLGTGSGEATLVAGRETELTVELAGSPSDGDGGTDLGGSSDGGPPDLAVPPSDGGATDGGALDGSTSPDMAPPWTARRAAAVVLLDGKVYVAGGYTTTVASDLLEVFDPTTGTWTRKQSMPAPRGGVVGFAIGGKLYVAGGDTCNDALVEYDPLVNGWTARAAMPKGQENAAAVTIGGEGYVFGGYCLGSVDATKVQKFNPSTGVWTTTGLTAMPRSRDRGGAVWVGGRAYIVGGQWGNGNYISNIDIYDPLNNTWGNPVTMQTPRSSLGVFACGHTIYAVDGANGSGYSTLVDAYDLNANAWSTVTSFGIGRWQLGAVATNGNIYALGGTTNEMSSITTVEQHGLACPPPVQAGSDFFNAATLGPQWTWVRENAAGWSLTASPGSMRITTAAGDIVRTSADQKNILLQAAGGDVTIQTRVTISPTAPAQQANVMFYKDDDNFVQLGVAYASNSVVISFVKEIAGTTTNVATSTDSMVGTPTVLRITRSGTIYTASYSFDDGRTFTPAGTTTAPTILGQVGIGATNGASSVASALNADFDWFERY